MKAPKTYLDCVKENKNEKKKEKWTKKIKGIRKVLVKS